MAYEHLFTSERLSRYGLKDEPLDNIIARYLWNIALSEALYPTLALLEVSLRNRVDTVMVQAVHSDWLNPQNAFWQRHPGREHQKLIETRLKLKPNTTRGHLVAELTFGFWVGLFKNAYKPSLWNKSGLFESVFPEFRAAKADRISFISPKLKAALILRNRISHHEAIFDMPKGLDTTLESIKELLYWISPSTVELLSRLDRFDKVYREGWPSYLEQV